MTAAEERSFGAAVYRLHPDLMRYARSLIGNKSGDAEDLASETMTRAWKARNRFEPGTNMRAWLFIILRNLFLSERRRDRWRGGYVDDLAIDMLPSSGAPQEGPLHFADAMRAFATLPQKQQDAVAHVALVGSYDDAAAAMNVPCGTIKSRVTRGRTALLEAIEAGARPKAAPAPAPKPAIVVVPLVPRVVAPTAAGTVRQWRGRPIKIPPSTFGTPLHRLCVLVTAHGGRGAARKLGVDHKMVCDAMRGGRLTPRLLRALEAYTEALAA